MAPSRLSSQEEVKKVFLKGKKYHFQPFFLWLYDKKELPFRSLVVCSKKVDKRATRRNLLKRRFREVLRRDIRRLFPTADVIVQIKPEGRDITIADIRELIFKKIHVL